MMQLNSKNHALYFKKTIDMLKSMISNGVCEDLRKKQSRPDGEQNWFNTKRGLTIFIVTMYKNKDEGADLYSLFESIGSKIREEMTREYEQLAKFVSQFKK